MIARIYSFIIIFIITDVTGGGTFHTNHINLYYMFAEDNLSLKQWQELREVRFICFFIPFKIR